MGGTRVERIAAAALAIDRVFLETPQYRSEALSELAGTPIVCKIESENPIGCFKGRGVDWWMRCRSRSGPVVCASAGNFGQALAYSARRTGTEAHVFVAETASVYKISAIQRLGARIHQRGRDFDDAKLEALEFARSRGWEFLEDGKAPEICEGSGTLALELERYPGPIDRLYLPVGNGALISGCGAWLKAHQSNTRVIGVCAEGAPAMQRSFRAGQPVSTERAETIADGIAVRIPVLESLETVSAAADDIVLVNDAQIARAVDAYYDYARLIAEPSGAVALAAALADAEQYKGQTLGVVLTGKNVAHQPAGERSL
jgi:threonine dehydratase